MRTDEPSPGVAPSSPLGPDKGRSSRSRMPKATPIAPTHAEISELAYRLWMERGAPIGSPEIDWVRAERVLLDSAQSPQNGPPEKALPRRRPRSGPRS